MSVDGWSGSVSVNLGNSERGSVVNVRRGVRYGSWSRVRYRSRSGVSYWSWGGGYEFSCRNYRGDQRVFAHNRVESVVWVGGVVDRPFGAIGLDQAVLSLHDIAVADFVLALGVSGDSVLHFVGETVRWMRVVFFDGEGFWLSGVDDLRWSGISDGPWSRVRGRGYVFGDWGVVGGYNAGLGDTDERCEYDELKQTNKNFAMLKKFCFYYKILTVEISPF